MEHPLDRASVDRKDLLKRLPGGVKAGAALLLLAWIASTPRSFPIGLVFPAGAIVAALLIGRISPMLLLKRMVIFEILAVTTSLLALAQPDGWQMFLFILTKATLSLSVAVVFSLTISFVELLHLLRQLHLPPILVTTVALLYRYLFVLTDQAQRMSRARASRAFGASKRRTWMLNSGIIGTLAIRSVERAEHVFNAMRARGWR